VATLVYHAGALGDFITALPAVAAWRALRAGEPCILLGRPAFAVLCVPPFDAVWDAGSAALAGLFSPEPGPALDRLAGITSALLFASASSPLPASLARAGVACVVRQDPFPPRPVPIVDWHLGLFAGRAFPDAERAPRVALAPRAGARVDVAVHPGSGSAAKNWPHERFAALTGSLARRGHSAAWVIGEAERGFAPPLGAGAWRSLPLDVLAGRLSACRLFVGNDSGVAHLAAAAGCPVIVLFGASDPRVWAPRGPRVRVLESGGGGMEGLSLREVELACREALERGEAAPGALA
jgi:heptosyltransferase III